MLSIASISDADYYLRDAACAGPRKASADSGPASYELDAIAQGEPPGEWYYPHRNDLGVSGEIYPSGPSGDAFRAVVNQMRHPVTGDPLGKAVPHYATVDERMERFHRKHRDATAEQIAQEKIKAESERRSGNHAWDMVFSAPKSWSVLHAALVREKRQDEADEVWASVRAGMDAALAVIADLMTYTRRGVAGPKVNGRTTTRHVRTEDIQTAIFRHHTSRDRDPQMHAHVVLINRILCEDGQWRAIATEELLRSKHMLDAVFLRVAEAEMTARLGARFVARPDGKAREVVGVSEEVCDLFSTRTRAVTEEAEEKIQQWRDNHKGEDPAKLIKWRIQRRAVLKTRKGKLKDAPDHEDEVARWDAEIAADFRKGFAKVLEETDLAACRPASSPDFDPDAVITMAMADLTKRKGVWNRSHLMHTINAHLPDMLQIEPSRVAPLLVELTDAALAGRQVVSLSAPPVAPVPASLTDEVTGESVFEAPTGGRFTTLEHLSREDELVKRLAARGAPVLRPETAEQVLSDRGLSAEQLTVATAILTSDQRVEVVNAGAGTGKSRLMAALSDASASIWGQGLVGFSSSQNAAEVLAREGVHRANNIAAFLTYRERMRAGRATDTDELKFAVPRDATVVIDEASMVSTPDLTALLHELDQVGVGRVVMIGDTAQVDAVDAGGAFGLLARERTPHTLTQVRRFEAQWERDASTALRDGDLTALAQYDARARIRGGGEPEEVEAKAVAAFVDDHLSGDETVLVVGSGEQAARLSSDIRQRLVARGHVVAEGVDLHDRTTAGVGDLIQTRLNDTNKLGVVNREVWQVAATDDSGAIEARRAERDDDGRRTWGEPKALPADYVKHHVELAYAATVEAVQGRTTDTGHLLVDEMMGRSRAYPGLTRGRSANTAWVPVVAPPRRQRESDAEYAARIPSPMAAMVAALEREDHTEAARVVIAAEQDRAHNLGHLGPQWQQLIAEHRGSDHRDLLREVTGTDSACLMSDLSLDGLLHLMRSAEAAGYDVREEVRRAYGATKLEGARSPASLLYARLDTHLKRKDVRPTAEVTRPESYAERVPAGANEELEYARQVAEAMDERVVALGEKATVEPPAWALALLGPVPAEPWARADWQEKVAVVAGYREQYGWEKEADPVGPAPSRAEPERRWAWVRAAAALGQDGERDVVAASEADLAEKVLAWRRTQESAPRNVDADLKLAYLERGQAKHNLVETRTRGEDTAEAEQVAADVEESIAKLEVIAAGRAKDVERTAPVRDKAQEAMVELERRVERDRVVAERAAARDAEREQARHSEVDEATRVHEAVGARFLEQYVEGAPVFGSPRWAELGDDEPAKRSSLFTAALSWWRAGNPRDEQALTERLAEHGADVAPEHSLSARGLERVRAGEDEREVRETEPSGELETLVEVHRYTAPELEGEAPEFGSPEYAEVEPEKQGKAEARAALRWFSAGDPLDERARRAGDLDERQASKAISEKMQETRHPYDERSHAEVVEARGEEAPERPKPEPEVEASEPEAEAPEPVRPDVSWVRDQPAERDTPDPTPAPRDDLAVQLERAWEVLAAPEPVREVEQPVVERADVER